MLAVVSGVSPAGLAMLPRASLAKRSVAVWTASSDMTLGDVACAYVCARVLTRVCVGCWPANSLVKKALERAAAERAVGSASSESAVVSVVIDCVRVLS